MKTSAMAPITAVPILWYTTPADNLVGSSARTTRASLKNDAARVTAPTPASSKRLGSRYRSGALAGLAEVQEPGGCGGEAVSGRELGKMRYLDFVTGIDGCAEVRRSNWG